MTTLDIILFWSFAGAGMIAGVIGAIVVSGRWIAVAWALFGLAALTVLIGESA